MANKANLRLWVAALRSGIYKQCSSMMRTQDGRNHCCLGVMQEVALRAGHLPKNDVPWGPTDRVEPSILQEFYGLEREDLAVDAGHVLNPTHNQLSILNDHYKWTFEEIADAVEKQFDLLTYDEIFDPEFVPTNETVAT